MKKIALSVALVAMMGVSFVSCNETAKEAPAQEEVVTETVEEVAAPVTEEAQVTEETQATEEAPVTEEAPATEETPAN